MISSTYTSDFPLGVILWTFTLNSLAGWNGIVSGNGVALGILSASLEYTFLYSQFLSSNKSFIVSVITSAATVNSDGHGDPPNGCLSDLKCTNYFLVLP